MDKYIILLVLSSMCSYDADGRSWPDNFVKGSSDGNHGVFFETSSGSYSDGSVRGNENLQFVYKQLRNWDPDRIWFPDFDEKNFSTGFRNASTEPIEGMTPAFSRNVKECIKQCPKTSEYNPVCGTNRKTYSNIGQLECARGCGVDVRVLRQLPCSLVFQESSTTKGSLILEEEQRRCIQTCPTTPEYNPICGTNNVTYQNRGSLECAKFCGVAVDLKRLSPCPKPIRNVSPAGQDQFDSDQARWATSASDSIKSSTVLTSDKPNVVIPQEILNEIFDTPAVDSKEDDIDVRLHE